MSDLIRAVAVTGAMSVPQAVDNSVTTRSTRMIMIGVVSITSRAMKVSEMNLFNPLRPLPLLGALLVLVVMAVSEAPVVLAQVPEWEKVFVNSDMHEAAAAVPLPDRILVVGPNATGESPIRLWAISHSGQRLWSTMVGEHRLWPQQAIRVGGNVAIFGIKSSEPVPGQIDSMAGDPFCVVVDTAGSLIAQHVYPQLWRDDVNRAFATIDGGMVLFVRGIPSRVLKLDSVGRLLWSRSDIWVTGELPSGDLINADVSWFDPKGEWLRTIDYKQEPFEVASDAWPLPDGGLMLINRFRAPDIELPSLFVYWIGADSIARNRVAWAPAGLWSFVNAIQPDNDGMLVTGTFDSSGMAGTNATALIARVSAGGAGTWSWHAPSRPEIESGFARAVRTSDGGTIAVGYSVDVDGSLPIGGRRPYLVKFRSGGSSGIPQLALPSTLDLR